MPREGGREEESGSVDRERERGSNISNTGMILGGGNTSREGEASHCACLPTYLLAAAASGAVAAFQEFAEWVNCSVWLVRSSSLVGFRYLS